MSERVRRLVLAGFVLALSWVEVDGFLRLSSETDVDISRFLPRDFRTLDAVHRLELMCLLHQADRRTWCLRANRTDISVLVLCRDILLNIL